MIDAVSRVVSSGSFLVFGIPIANSCSAFFFWSAVLLTPCICLISLVSSLCAVAQVFVDVDRIMLAPYFLPTCLVVGLGAGLFDPPLV